MGLDPVSPVVVVPCSLVWEGSPVLRRQEPMFLGQHRVLDHPKRAVSIASVITSFLASGDLSSADNHCKQFGHRSVLTKCLS